MEKYVRIHHVWKIKKKVGKNMGKKVLLIGIMIVIISTLAGCSDSTQNKNTNYNSAPWQDATEARIPVSDISTTANFYTYDSDGTSIRYFAVKDNLGNVHVAFDACDVCYEAKKGYQQNDNVMQCLNCGKEFSITSIGTDNTAGGCWPSYLPMTIDNGNIVIKISDLKAKSFMF